MTDLISLSPFVEQCFVTVSSVRWPLGLTTYDSSAKQNSATMTGSFILFLQWQLEQPNSVPSGHRFLLLFGQIDRLPPVLRFLDCVVRCIWDV